MSESSLHHDDRPLTPARTSAGWQMRADESTHHGFVEASKRQMLLGEPVRKVADGVTIRDGDRGRIPVPFEIRAIRRFTRTQDARGEPRAPGRSDHGCSSWK